MISKLLKILASNIIFRQQVFHCHLQSSYFKLYLSATYMSYGIAYYLTFLLIVLVAMHYLLTSPHALTHKYDAHDIF